MEKPVGENDLKGLEAEIDSAVDRLFVEEEGPAQILPTNPTVMEPSLVIEKPYETFLAPSYDYDEEKNAGIERTVIERPMVERLMTEWPTVEKPMIVRPSVLTGSQGLEEGFFAGKPSPAPSASIPVSDPMEEIETQLLSLEWEITKEGIEKTKNMVVDLRDRWSGQPEIASVLNRIEMVLTFMVKSEANIHPPLIKFLIDAKDTIKFLRQEETTQEIKIYKQLAYDGIEARFFFLREVREARTEKPSQDVLGEGDRTVLPEAGWKKIGEMAENIDLFSSRMNGTLEKIEQRLSRLENQTLKSSGDLARHQSPLVTFMVFKVDARLFGVQNDQVFKLFKVPTALRDKYKDQQRIRLKDGEVKLVDLKKLFSLQEKDFERELKILIVKDDGGYKGLMIEQVLQKVSAHPDLGKGTSDYFMGSIPWTYQEHPVEISVLNVKKL